MRSALTYIIQAVANLFLFIMLLRFWMPWFRATFNNAVAQAILRITNPLVVPLRRVLPPISRVDTATIVVAFGVQYLAVFLYTLVWSINPTVMHISLTALLDLGILSAGLKQLGVDCRTFYWNLQLIEAMPAADVTGTSWMDFFIGNVHGSMGETCTLACSLDS